ncbi:MAG: hypothetical protein II743_01270 [Lachnospiraceae bacterium]|nr:hypothetical protein [Lachnospiraceae bacterium]
MEADEREGKRRIGLYLTNENLASISELSKSGDARTKSEFVNRAVDFYAGYLKTERTETYVMHSVSSMIHSALDLSEMRIKEMLFKLAVEISMQNRILARMARVSEKEIGEIRDASVGEVRRIMK